MLSLLQASEYLRRVLGREPLAVAAAFRAIVCRGQTGMQGQDDLFKYNQTAIYGFGARHGAPAIEFHQKTTKERM